MTDEILKVLREENKFLRQEVATLKAEIASLREAQQQTCGACLRDFPQDEVLWVATRYECEACYATLTR